MMPVANSPVLRGRLLQREPMAEHTSWRVGGPADRYYQPADIDDAAAFLATLPPEEPVFWLGLGSNLLVRDGGIRGAVIATAGRLTGLALVAPDVVRAEVGVSDAKLARFCAGHDLRGAEFLAGVPGTVGGALAMNAGAHGGETWSLVETVETLGRDGRRHYRTRHEYQLAYRHVAGPADEWFVAANFKLARGDGEAARAQMKSWLARRNQTQPTQLANAGSVFKNPPGDYAARLIETAGLKGICEGQACVSELHANFIVNRGGARAADIEALIHRIRAEVERVHGVALQPEVRIVGEAA